MSERVILISFLAGPQIISYSNLVLIFCTVDIQVSWADLFCPNDPSKFQIVHQNLDFCMQMNVTWVIGPFSLPILILDQK